MCYHRSPLDHLGLWLGIILGRNYTGCLHHDSIVTLIFITRKYHIMTMLSHTLLLQQDYYYMDNIQFTGGAGNPVPIDKGATCHQINVSLWNIGSHFSVLVNQLDYLWYMGWLGHVLLDEINNKFWSLIIQCVI